MILEIDIGNTFLKWRLLGDAGEVFSNGRVPTAGSFADLPLIWGASIDRVRVGSVASDEVNRKLRDLLVGAGYPAPKFARTGASAAGVTNSYANPSAMGVDRWLAMLAAWKHASGACCVVDCGSAITIDYLSEDGRHLGGYILPGMRVLQQALLGNTARVFVDRAAAEFDPSPGCNTGDAVTHGADFIFDAIQARVKQGLKPGMHLFVTGGDGKLFQRLIGCGEWSPDLVLDGLVLALEEA